MLRFIQNIKSPMTLHTFLGITFAGPVQLLMITIQILCYLNSYYVVVFLLGPLPFALILIITLAKSRALYALYYANCTHLHASPDNPDSRYCKKCELFILNRDHHCIFTGRCVQKYNYQYFISYVLYSYTLSGYLVGAILREYEILLNIQEVPLRYAIPLVFGLVSGLYFLIFTGGLLSSSFRSIILGIYVVEELKKQKTPKYTNWQIRKMWFSSKGRSTLCTDFDNQTLISKQIGKEWWEIRYLSSKFYQFANDSFNNLIYSDQKLFTSIRKELFRLFDQENSLI